MGKVKGDFQIYDPNEVCGSQEDVNSRSLCVCEFPWVCGRLVFLSEDGAPKRCFCAPFPSFSLFLDWRDGGLVDGLGGQRLEQSDPDTKWQKGGLPGKPEFWKVCVSLSACVSARACACVFGREDTRDICVSIDLTGVTKWSLLSLPDGSLL